jgi:hypothetical protein
LTPNGIHDIVLQRHPDTWGEFAQTAIALMFDPLAEAFRSAGFTPRESEAGAVRDVDG